VSLLTEQHDLARVCSRMQHRGMRLDLARLREVEKQMSSDKLVFENQFEINLRSPHQVMGFFQERYGLKLPDARKETIKSYAARHPEAPELMAIANYKDLGKGLAAWFGPEHRVGDYIHPRWNPTGTVERRLSCSNPNAQNVPHRNPYFSKLMRSVIIPEPGCLLVELDASQGEDWSTGYAAQDSKLLGDLVSGVDFHSRTASYIFKHLCPKSTHPVERDCGKMWNHAHKYGQGFNFALKSSSDCARLRNAVRSGLHLFGWDGGDYIVTFSATRLAELTWGKKDAAHCARALSIKQKLMGDYSGIVSWQHRTFDSWRKTGYVTNPFKFSRPLYGKEHECAKRGFAFIGASTLQTPVILAMIEVDARGHHLCGQIHDSLLFSIPERRLLVDIAEVKAICETDRQGLKIPWEAKTGANWSEC